MLSETASCGSRNKNNRAVNQEVFPLPVSQTATNLKLTKLLITFFSSKYNTTHPLKSHKASERGKTLKNALGWKKHDPVATNTQYIQFAREV